MGSSVVANLSVYSTAGRKRPAALFTKPGSTHLDWFELTMTLCKRLQNQSLA